MAIPISRELCDHDMEDLAQPVKNHFAGASEVLVAQALGIRSDVRDRKAVTIAWAREAADHWLRIVRHTRNR
ncbi:MAG TPA: hypothetical protein VGA62_00760, partial [Acidimicrobiia bacterium]